MQPEGLRHYNPNRLDCTQACTDLYLERTKIMTASRRSGVEVHGSTRNMSGARLEWLWAGVLHETRRSAGSIRGGERMVNRHGSSGEPR